MLVFVLVKLKIEHKAFYMLGKQGSTEVYFQQCLCVCERIRGFNHRGVCFVVILFLRWSPSQPRLL